MKELSCDADLVVLGGGAGGIGAAVTAARNGLKVLLIENFGFLGGTAVFSEVHPFMSNDSDYRPLDRPVFVDLVQAMHRYYPKKWRLEPFDRELPGNRCRNILKDALILAAEDLCLEAGVRLLYHHRLTGVDMREKQIEAIHLLTKNGPVKLHAPLFIDATGDGDLAAMAGCGFELGDENGVCQAMTLTFKLAGVVKPQMPSPETINRLYDEARQRGDIDCPRPDLLMLPTFEEDVIHFNTTRVNNRSGLDAQDLSEAQIEGRRQMRQIIRFLNHAVPGFQDAYLCSSAHHIGVRETRRIHGLQYLTLEAFRQCLQAPDAIARVSYPIDIHNPSGADVLEPIRENSWYEIPYGCIVPRDCANLLMGCRAISVDHAIHASMRIMPAVCSIGQAAGMAAALAVKEQRSPANLDGCKVRAALVEFGARLS